MRVYPRDQACAFRYTRAAWGAFSNFQPLPVPIVAGPWSFGTSEAAYQACKFPAHPGVQKRIAEAPTARGAAARPVSASTPAGTSSASTSCAGCCV